MSVLRTTLQELLADASSTEQDPMSYQSLTTSVVQKLDDFFGDLLDEVTFRQFDEQTKFDQLLIARWNLHRPKENKFDTQVSSLMSSTASTYVTASRDNSEESALDATYSNYPLAEAEPFLLKFYNTIKGSVDFYCKLYSEIFQGHEELVQMSSHYVIAVSFYTVERI